MTSNFFLYKKPDSICQSKTLWDSHFNSDNFISSLKNEIETNINAQEFSLRFAVNDDIPDIEILIAKCYPVEALRDSNPYDFYRFINFGHGLLVEDKSKNLIGCVFEEPYDTPDKTSYGLRLAIDKDAKARDLGRLLVEYSSLLAMERGSMVKRSLIQADNFVATHIVLNKLGWICDGYHPDLKWINPSFTANWPLTVESVAYNRIDPDKLVVFLKENSAGIDYIISDWDDVEGLKKIYDEGEFVICAQMKPGLFNNEKFQFVSLPIKTIKIG